jgi:hypothetical protein
MGTAHAAITIFHTPFGGTQRNVGAAIGTLSAFIETKAISIGDSQLSYFLDKINSHITKSANQTLMILEVYGSDDEDGPFDLLDTISLSKEDPGYMDPPGKRYYKFRFSDSSISSRWQLHGFEVYGEPGGDEF